MAETVREKIWVEFRDTNGNWKPAYGYYPPEWLCGLPECNRATKSSNRCISHSKSNRNFCTPECRAIFLGRERRKKKE